GALTVAVFANQRQLISGVGLLLIVLIYLISSYHHSTDNSQTESDRKSSPDKLPIKKTSLIFSAETAVLIFSGVLIGLLPYWNSAVYVAALVILGGIWLCFPGRLAQLYLLVTAILVGLPQIMLLRAGAVTQPGDSLFHFGYTIQNPTVPLVLQYLGWTFGLKWLLLGLALWWFSGLQRRLVLAVSFLLLAVFSLKLSTDVFNNHKLLNIWNIFATMCAAYAIWRIGKANVAGAALAVALTLLMVFTSVIELFPIYNDVAIKVPYRNDRLTAWVLQNTQPSDVFLTHNFLSHPILFAGRKVFLAYTLFAWTAGYNVSAREAVYIKMFEERDSLTLLRLLQENKISYVGIDNSLRRHHLVKNLNEAVYQQHFQKVFEDTENKYDNLTLYKVR
ncbi:MAG: hypothetical protein HOP19_02980, partial [Acidobacteria bacterium]|nr:hypothetical protein [Acidobacteriota bacterium]